MCKVVHVFEVHVAAETADTYLDALEDMLEICLWYSPFGNDAAYLSGDSYAEFAVKRYGALLDSIYRIKRIVRAVKKEGDADCNAALRK